MSSLRSVVVRPRTRPRGHEQIPHKENNTANRICRSSRAKPELAFICIGRCPMLWLFRPLQGLSFILLTAKVYQNSSLKIFALVDCGYALFLLSANIYQAAFSVRKGLIIYPENQKIIY